jgi:hypothetical protein
MNEHTLTLSHLRISKMKCQIKKKNYKKLPQNKTISTNFIQGILWGTTKYITKKAMFPLWI